MRIQSALGALLCLTSVAFAQGTAPPNVSEIVITNIGSGQIDLSFVHLHTSVRTNTPLNRHLISRDVRALLDAGRFTKVSAFVEPVGKEIRVIYSLKNKLRLVHMPVVEGNDQYRPSRIQKILDLRVGSLVDEATLGDAARRLLAEYREDRYPDAEMTWSIREIDSAKGTAEVRIQIDEGKRARIRDIHFQGNQQFSDAELRDLARPRDWWNPFSWMRRMRYNPEAMEAARRLIRQAYLEEGYLSASVEEPDVVREEDGSVSVSYEVHEGVRYHVGHIRLTGKGLDIFPETDLESLLSTRTGDKADMQQLERDARKIRDFFGARGYIQTRVNPLLDPSPESGLVDVELAITEGELIHIRNIDIRGNTRTRDKVIRRELLVYPGDVYNEVKVRQSERVVNNLGFFSAVRSDPVDTRIPTEKDLVLKVEEKRTGQFMLGAGFSSIDNLIGFVELSQGNFDLKAWPYFTGAGQKLRLRAQFGSKRDELELSFVEPWFLDRKLSFGLDLFRTSLNYTDYDEERLGGAMTLGKALPGPNRVSLRYQLVSSDIEDVADTNEYRFGDSETDESFYFDDDQNSVKSSMTLRFTHDTRDNPFFPTRGDRLILSCELAGGPFGFDRDLYDIQLRSFHYRPLWWQHVISFRTHWEVVESYGDTDEVPINDRLFIGGGRSIRGYKYRDVGPKVIRADGGSSVHRPVGGQTLALAKMEYTVPVVSGVRVAGFFDIGNVWRDSYDFEFSGMASSTGVGLRFDMPGFPIRIDRAWPVEPDSELTDTDTWVFWVGFD
jgi:outer membrane protein insertion porin family